MSESRATGGLAGHERMNGGGRATLADPARTETSVAAAAAVVDSSREERRRGGGLRNIVQGVTEQGASWWSKGRGRRPILVFSMCMQHKAKLVIRFLQFLS